MDIQILLFTNYKLSITDKQTQILALSLFDRRLKNWRLEIVEKKIENTSPCFLSMGKSKIFNSKPTY